MLTNSKVFGDFALFSLGRISKGWSHTNNDGLICANDSETLGEENPIKFSIFYEKNETDGDLTGKKSLIINGSVFNYGPREHEFSKDVSAKIESINPWEIEILESFISESEYGSNFYFSDDDFGLITIGESGEIRLDQQNSNFAPGSMVINGTFYRDVALTINLASPYGLDLNDAQPDESQDLCAIIWAPTTFLLGNSINKAKEYDQDYNGSLSLFIGIIEQWKSTKTEELNYCWNFILENIDRESNVKDRMRVARLAKKIIKDDLLFRKIINDSIKLADTPSSNSSHIILTVIGELAEDFDENQSEIKLLMDEAVNKASAESEEDICSIIELIGGDYDKKFGDLDFARASIEIVLSRANDSKTKMSIKKKAEKTLKAFL